MRSRDCTHLTKARIRANQVMLDQENHRQRAVPRVYDQGGRVRYRIKG